MKDNTDELLPCPFCNVQPKIEIEEDDDGYGYAWSSASISARHEKECPLYISQECGNNSGSIQIVDFLNSDLDEFIAAWNTRAALQQPDQSEVIRDLAGQLEHAHTNFDFLLRAINRNDPQLEIELRCKDGKRYIIQTLTKHKEAIKKAGRDGR